MHCLSGTFFMLTYITPNLSKAAVHSPVNNSCLVPLLLVCVLLAGFTGIILVVLLNFFLICFL